MKGKKKKKKELKNSFFYTNIYSPCVISLLKVSISWGQVDKSVYKVVSDTYSNIISGTFSNSVNVSTIQITERKGRFH